MTLYRDVALAIGSVFFLGVFAIYTWWVDLRLEVKNKPYVWEMFAASVKYVYFPFVSVCFVFGQLTKNISQVDKVWSIVPPCFCWYITVLEASQHNMSFNYKLVLMSIVVTMWGVRLTYQFFKKGGYRWKIWSGEEDYRWAVVRKEMSIIFKNYFFFTLFNFGFICVYQLLLLFLISAGVMIATILSNDGTFPRRDLETKDLVIFGIVLLFLIIETISDYQQQVFQREKYRRLKEKLPLDCLKEHYEAGFITTGLFSYSRHPNFAAEQAIWLAFYFFSVNLSGAKRFYEIGGIFNISIIGALLLIILFAKSTDLTEKISASKYPLYTVYQNQVNRILDMNLVVGRLLFFRSPKDIWMTSKIN